MESYGKSYWKKEAKRRDMAYFHFELDLRHKGLDFTTSTGVLDSEEALKLSEFIQEMRRKRETTTIKCDHGND